MSDTKAQSTIPLEGSLNVSAASDLLDRLRAALASGDQPGRFDLDMADVTRIDTACLQVLVAFALDAQTSGSEVRWQKAPEVVVEATRSLGLQEFLPSGGDAA